MPQIMTYVLPGLFGLVILFAVIGFFAGMKRGFLIQCLRIASMAVAAVASYLVTSALYGRLTAYCAGKTFSEGLTGLHLSFLLKIIPENVLALLDGLDQVAVGYAAALPIVLLLPLLFVVLFFLCYLIVSIVYKILACLLGFTKGLGGLSGRILGAILGVVQGAAIAAMILLPVISAADVVSTVSVAVQETNPDSEQTVAITSFDNTYCEPVLASPVSRAVRAVGGDFICNRFATVDIDGTEVSMREEIPAYAGAYGTAMRLQGADFNHLTDDNKEAVRELIRRADENHYMKIVLAGALRALATSVDSGTVSLNTGEPYRSFVLSVLDVFTTSDKSNVIGDLTTLTEAYFVLADAGVIENFNGGVSAWRTALAARDDSGENAIRHAVTILDANPRTRSVTASLTDISVAMLMDRSELSDETRQAVENVREGLNDVLAIRKEACATEEEYVTQVADTMDAALKKSGIEIDRDILDGVAQELSDNEEFQQLAGADKATVTEFVLAYYDVYLGMTEA